MSKDLIREIVAPEPHSMGTKVGKAWEHFPRWLRILLVLVLISAGILAAVFVKD